MAGVVITPNLAAASVGPPGPSGPTGPVGPQGPTGQGFQIAKIYPSDSALLADNPPSGVLTGQFGFVSSTNPDNGDLYLWQGVGPGWLFTGNLAAGAVIPGPPGPQGPSGPTGPAGPSSGVFYALLGTIDATSGLTIGAHAFPSPLPAKYVIEQAFMDVITPFTSGTSTATLALQVLAPNDLLGATGVADLPAAGSYDLVPNSAGNAIKTVVATAIQVVVGTEALTGGKALVFGLVAASI